MMLIVLSLPYGQNQADRYRNLGRTCRAATVVAVAAAAAIVDFLRCNYLLSKIKYNKFLFQI